ncbi:MAG: hypothetical protein ACRDCG_02685, partial [Mycoplasmoidaceae bacterium]
TDEIIRKEIQEFDKNLVNKLERDITNLSNETNNHLETLNSALQTAIDKTKDEIYSYSDAKLDQFEGQIDKKIDLLYDTTIKTLDDLRIIFEKQLNDRKNEFQGIKLKIDDFNTKLSKIELFMNDSHEKEQEYINIKYDIDSLKEYSLHLNDKSDNIIKSLNEESERLELVSNLSNSQSRELKELSKATYDALEASVDRISEIEFNSEIIISKIKELEENNFDFIKKEMSKLSSDADKNLFEITNKLETAVENAKIDMNNFVNKVADSLDQDFNNKFETWNDIILETIDNLSNKFSNKFNDILVYFDKLTLSINILNNKIEELEQIKSITDINENQINNITYIIEKFNHEINKSCSEINGIKKTILSQARKVETIEDFAKNQAIQMGDLAAASHNGFEIAAEKINELFSNDELIKNEISKIDNKLFDEINNRIIILNNKIENDINNTINIMKDIIDDSANELISKIEINSNELNKKMESNYGDFNVQIESIYNTLINIIESERIDNKNSFEKFSKLIEETIVGDKLANKIIEILNEKMTEEKSSIYSYINKIKKDMLTSKDNHEKTLKSLKNEWIENSKNIFKLQGKVTNHSELISDLSLNTFDLASEILQKEQDSIIFKTNFNKDIGLLKNKNIDLEKAIKENIISFKNEIHNIVNKLEIDLSNNSENIIEKINSMSIDIDFRIDELINDYNNKIKSLYDAILAIIEDEKNDTKMNLNEFKESIKNLEEDLLMTRMLIDEIDKKSDLIHDQIGNITEEKFNLIKQHLLNKIASIDVDIKLSKEEISNNLHKIIKFENDLLSQSSEILKLSNATSDAIEVIADNQLFLSTSKDNLYKNIETIKLENKDINKRIRNLNEDLNLEIFNTVEKLNISLEDFKITATGNYEKFVHDIQGKMELSSDEFKLIVNELNEENNLKITELKTAILDIIFEEKIRSNQAFKEFSKAFRDVNNEAIKFAEISQEIQNKTNNLELLNILSQEEIIEMKNKINNSKNNFELKIKEYEEKWKSNNLKIKEIEDLILKHSREISNLSLSTLEAFDEVIGLHNSKFGIDGELTNEIKILRNENNEIINLLSTEKERINQEILKITEELREEFSSSIEELRKEIENKISDTLHEVIQMINDINQISKSNKKSILDISEIIINNKEEINKINENILINDVSVNNQFESINKFVNLHNHELENFKNDFEKNQLKIKKIDSQLDKSYQLINSISIEMERDKDEVYSILDDISQNITRNSSIVNFLKEENSELIKKINLSEELTKKAVENVHSFIELKISNQDDKFENMIDSKEEVKSQINEIYISIMKIIEENNLSSSLMIKNEIISVSKVINDIKENIETLKYECGRIDNTNAILSSFEEKFILYTNNIDSLSQKQNNLDSKLFEYDSQLYRAINLIKDSNITTYESIDEINNLIVNITDNYKNIKLNINNVEEKINYNKNELIDITFSIKNSVEELREFINQNDLERNIDINLIKDNIKLNSDYLEDIKITLEENEQKIVNLESEFNNKYIEMISSMTLLIEDSNNNHKKSFKLFELINKSLSEELLNSQIIIKSLVDDVEKIKEFSSLETSKLDIIINDMVSSIEIFNAEIHGLKKEWSENNNKIIEIQRTAFNHSKFIDNLSRVDEDLLEIINNNKNIDTLSENINELVNKNKEIEKNIENNNNLLNDEIFKLKNNFYSEFNDMKNLSSTEIERVDLRINELNQELINKSEDIYTKFMGLIDDIRSDYKDNNNEFKVYENIFTSKLNDLGNNINTINDELFLLKDSNFKIDDLLSNTKILEQEFKSLYGNINELNNKWNSNNLKILMIENRILEQATNINVLSESTDEILSKIINDKNLKDEINKINIENNKFKDEIMSNQNDINSIKEFVSNIHISLEERIKETSKISSSNNETLYTYIMGIIDDIKNISIKNSDLIRDHLFEINHKIDETKDKILSIGNKSDLLEKELEIFGLPKFKGEILDKIDEHSNILDNFSENWIKNSQKINILERRIFNEAINIKELADSTTIILDNILENKNYKSLIDEMNKLNDENKIIENNLKLNISEIENIKILVDEKQFEMQEYMESLEKKISNFQDDVIKENQEIKEMIIKENEKFEVMIREYEIVSDEKRNTMLIEILAMIDYINNYRNDEINKYEIVKNIFKKELAETKMLLSIVNDEVKIINKTLSDDTKINDLEFELRNKLNTIESEMEKQQNVWLRNSNKIQNLQKNVIEQAKNIKNITENTESILDNVLNNVEIEKINKNIDNIQNDNNNIMDKLNEYSNDISIIKNNIDDLHSDVIEKINENKKDFNNKNTQLYSAIMNIIGEVKNDVYSSINKIKSINKEIRNNMDNSISNVNLLLKEVDVLKHNKINSQEIKNIERLVLNKYNDLNSRIQNNQNELYNNNLKMVSLEKKLYIRTASLRDLAVSVEELIEYISNDSENKYIINEIKKLAIENKKIERKIIENNSQYNNELIKIKEEIHIEVERIKGLNSDSLDKIDDKINLFNEISLNKISDLESNLDHKNELLFKNIMDVINDIKDYYKDSVINLKQDIKKNDKKIVSFNEIIKKIDLEMDTFKKYQIETFNLEAFKNNIEEKINLYKEEMQTLHMVWSENNKKIGNIENNILNHSKQITDIASSTEEILDNILDNKNIKDMIGQINQLVEKNKNIETKIESNREKIDQSIQSIKDKYDIEFQKNIQNGKEIEDINKSISSISEELHKKIEANEKTFFKNNDSLYQNIMEIIDSLRSKCEDSINSFQKINSNHEKDFIEIKDFMNSCNSKIKILVENKIDIEEFNKNKKLIEEEFRKYYDKSKYLENKWDSNNNSIIKIEEKISKLIDNLKNISEGTDEILNNLIENKDLNNLISEVKNILSSNSTIKTNIELNKKELLEKIENFKDKFNQELIQVKINSDEIIDIRDDIESKSREIYDRMQDIENNFDNKYGTLYNSIMELIEKIREENQESYSKMDFINKIILDDIIEAKVVISKISNEIILLKSSNLNVEKLEDIAKYIDLKFAGFIEQMSVFQISWLSNKKKISELEKTLNEYSTTVKGIIENSDDKSIILNIDNYQISEITSDILELREANIKIENMMNLNKDLIDAEIKKMNSDFNKEANNIKQEFAKIWDRISNKLLNNYEYSSSSNRIDSSIVDKLMEMINKNSSEIQRYSDESINEILSLTEKLDGIELKVIVSENEINKNKILIDGIRDFIKGTDKFTLDEISESEIDSVISKKLLPLIDETKELSYKLISLEETYHNGVRNLENNINKLIDDLESRIEIKITEEFNIDGILTTDESKKIIAELAIEEVNKMLNGYSTRKEINNDFNLIKLEMDSIKNDILNTKNSFDGLSIDMINGIVHQSEKLQKTITYIEELFKSSKNGEILNDYFVTINDLKLEITDNRRFLEKLSNEININKEKINTYDDIIKNNNSENNIKITEIFSKITTIDNINKQTEANYNELLDSKINMEEEFKKLITELDIRADKLIKTYLNMLSDYDLKIQEDIKKSIDKIDIIIDPSEVLNSDVAKNIIKEYAIEIANIEFNRLKEQLNKYQIDTDKNIKDILHKNNSNVIKDIEKSNKNILNYEKLINIDELFEAIIDGMQEISEKSNGGKDYSTIMNRIKELEKQINFIKSNSNDFSSDTEFALSDETKDIIKKLIEKQKNKSEK